MPSNERARVSKTVLFVSAFFGYGLALLTQLGVMMQHSTRVYISLLWAPLYPVQLYLTDNFSRLALALHVPVGDAAAKSAGAAVSSLLLAVVAPALVGLARSSSNPVRYASFAALTVLVLMAVIWFPMPNGL